MLDNNPWEDMLAGSQAGAAYGSLPMGTADLVCDSCLSTLYAALPTTGDCFGSDAAFSDACRADPTVAPALSAFAACTGGHYMNTYGCTHLTDAVFDYHPFQAYVSCANDSDLVSCLERTMYRTFIPTAESCAPCHTTFSSAILPKDVTPCATNKYSQGCIDVFDTQPTTGTLGSPLKEFEICTGKTVDRTDKTCTTAEWRGLTYKFRSLVPIYVAVKRVARINAAGSVIANDANLVDFAAVITGITCRACFDILTVDLYTLYRFDPDVESACANPYTSECETALATPLRAFQYCSGRVLNRAPTNTICTYTQYSALIDFGVAESIVAAAIDSKSDFSFTKALKTLHTSVYYSDLEAPCWSCFAELAYAVFNLNEFDLAVCKDILSSACDQIIGDYIIGFEDCSGSLFILGAITTTIVPTTTVMTPAGVGITASATIEVTYTTAAVTTTKSSIFPVYSSGLAVLILLVAL